MKRIKLYILTIICFMMFTTNVMADGSIKASSNSITKGNTVTVTATISSSSPLVSIEGSLSCSGAGVNGGTDLKFDDSSNSVYSKSFTYSAKATATGTITCSLNGAKYTDMSADSWKAVGASTITIKVSEPVKVPPKELSTDNNLKSLSIDQYQISPEFNRDVTEYKLTVDESVEKINVQATASHNKASVTGIGEVNLSSGENTIEIKVTAENGNEKKYKIIVTVEDQNPIAVKVGKKKYTIVKKNNNLIDKLDYYDEKTIQIDQQDVVAYTNAKTKVTLVLLKDENNKIAYYVYNQNSKEYTEYHSLTIQGITLQLLDGKQIPKYYTKYQETIQEQKVDIYKLQKNHKVGLIYGTNLKTGNTGFYVYDANEETLSKYFEEEVNLYQNEMNHLKNYMMIFIGVVSFVVIIFIIISLICGKKRKKKIAKVK